MRSTAAATRGSQHMLVILTFQLEHTTMVNKMMMMMMMMMHLL